MVKRQFLICKPIFLKAAPNYIYTETFLPSVNYEHAVDNDICHCI